MAVAADLSKYLDKAYENKTLEEVLAAPVSALAGVTDADGELLQKAFNIKTVGDLVQEQVLRLRTRHGRLEQLSAPPPTAPAPRGTSPASVARSRPRAVLQLPRR